MKKIMKLTNFKHYMMAPISLVFFVLAMLVLAPAQAKPLLCRDVGVGLQVLGSGGPEITDQRASSSYLVWRDGRAQVLIDMGPGSMLQFEQSGARIEDLQVILLTHLHVDHAADLPALIKASFFTERRNDLPIYGPTGNTLMPGTQAFVEALFKAEGGAFRYLGGYLSGAETYRLQAHEIPAQGKTATTAMNNTRLKLVAVPVHHGPIPALAWRIEMNGRVIVISGDMNGDNHTLESLAAGADLLVAHHAIPEETTGVARNLHMPPSVIANIAATAKVKRVVLSHRMTRTFGREQETTQIIRKQYAGPLAFADDGQCFSLDK